MPNLGEGRTLAQRSCLPHDLSRRGSDLDRLITIAGDAAARGTFGAANTVDVTRGMLRRLCPDYRPRPYRHIHFAAGFLAVEVGVCHLAVMN
jgi:hypothetical protein